MFKNKKAIRIIILTLLIIGILFGGCAIYVSNFYEADEATIETVLTTSTVTVEEKNGFTAFIPKDDTNIGFIFYPGGKVDHRAYYPLVKSLAEYGILAAVVEMPFKLAVLDQNAAENVKKNYPNIENWYLGGHSLGGAMAATHISKNKDSFEGLILLGAYSTKDLSDTELAALSIYGSNDDVMDREKYEKCLSNMPKKFTEFVIDGGCHAYFGCYGEQKGDGTPTLTNEEQICITAAQIYQFIYP